METPQLENGYLKIATDIAKYLAKTYMSSYETQILWAVFIKTYGFHKKEDWISNGQFTELTLIRKNHVSRTVKKLIQRRIVTQTGNKIAFQKDRRLWKELPKQVTNKIVTQTGIPKLPKQVQLLPKQVFPLYTKDTYTKDTTTKDIEGFPEFLARFNQLFGKSYRPTPGLKVKYLARLKLFTPSEILSAVESLAKSKFHKGENDRGWKADPSFLLRSDEQVDKWRAKEEVFKPTTPTLASMIPDTITNF